MTPESLIIVQYVGKRRGPAPTVVEIEVGRFTVKGRAGRQFRYVVFQ